MIVKLDTTFNYLGAHIGPGTFDIKDEKIAEMLKMRNEKFRNRPNTQYGLGQVAIEMEKVVTGQRRLGRDETPPNPTLTRKIEAERVDKPAAKPEADEVEEVEEESEQGSEPVKEAFPPAVPETGRKIDADPVREPTGSGGKPAATGGAEGGKSGDEGGQPRRIGFPDN